MSQGHAVDGLRQGMKKHVSVLLMLSPFLDVRAQAQACANGGHQEGQLSFSIMD
jgi:hypothetical protein